MAFNPNCIYADKFTWCISRVKPKSEFEGGRYCIPNVFEKCKFKENFPKPDASPPPPRRDK